MGGDGGSSQTREWERLFFVKKKKNFFFSRKIEHDIFLCETYDENFDFYFSVLNLYIHF